MGAAAARNSVMPHSGPAGAIGTSQRAVAWLFAPFKVPEVFSSTYKVSKPGGSPSPKVKNESLWEVHQLGQSIEREEEALAHWGSTWRPGMLPGGGSHNAVRSMRPVPSAARHRKRAEETTIAFRKLPTIPTAHNTWTGYSDSAHSTMHM